MLRCIEIAALIFMLVASIVSGVPLTQGQRGVIVLTSRSFDASIRDGSIWLVEFYAPWCGHCKTFAPSYEELARSVHAENKEGQKQIKIAKVDVDAERAIISRFNVAGFPSFFLIDGWTVYEYNDGRSVSSMMTFVKGGYKQKEALPFYSSPMGPLGQLQGLLMFVAIQALRMFEWLQSYFGFSPVVAGVLLACTFIFTGLFAMISIALMCIPKEKTD